MTQAELLDAVREALAKQSEDDGPVGVTTTELAEATGSSVDMARSKIKELVRAGKARPVKVKRPRWDGVHNWVPAIQLVDLP